ncbi:unnamed protein product [Medioppia subpectinata]|uniref:IBR domain-containing protein n=1 Tax=Medioppia subpectinata TaxID=1979941 RepID=A0A7R9PZZ3_9ACAR|nr:unnamed protein product [Medioppia subpectinata]CAG2106990.1 unnamed protein product [Medioppia subpectinata]
MDNLLDPKRVLYAWPDHYASIKDDQVYTTCGLGIVQSMSGTYMIAVLTSVEKRQLKGASVKEVERMDYDTSMRGIWHAVIRVLTNPLFMFNMIGNALRYMGGAGYRITKPKYMESQYRVSGSKANLLTGLTGVVPVGIGILAGGIGIRYLKPKPITLIVYIFALEWVSNSVMFTSIFLGCPPLQLGPNTEFTNTKYTMNAGCNQGCDCTNSVFTPMCSADKVTTYFSPCYAGSYIPYSMIFGAIADSACLIWESTCGKTGCDTMASQIIIKRLVDTDSYDRYEYLTLKHAAGNMPDVCYCPNEQCNWIVEMNNTVGANCGKCKLEFCTKCRKHYHGACDYDEQRERMYCEQEEQANAMIASTTKSCPGCGSPIEVYTTMGLGSWRPQWLQRFGTPFWFIVVYAIIGVVQTRSNCWLPRLRGKRWSLYCMASGYYPGYWQCAERCRLYCLLGIWGRIH